MPSLYDLFTEHPRISTDSRHIEAGSIFFALRGASFDGNRFAAAALAGGAAFAVVDDPAIAATDRARMLLVPDVLAALQELAREHRRELGLPILAVTGSNGKTTTKELLSRVLAERFEVCATRGNLNNHIGVPLTLLSMNRDTEFGIVEMGASAGGEIALLCSIAEPNYGLITNIGRAHLEGFGGPEGVRRGKGELYDYLALNGGRAFVPRWDDTLVTMAAQRDPLAVEYYSDTLADGVENHLEGDYNRANIAAAVAVGRYFDVDEARILHAVAGYRPDNNRSQRTETARNTLVVDCYNANPSSMRAALANFRAELPGRCSSKVLILGDMLELGAWSREEHIEIVREAEKMENARILLVGNRFADACEAMGSRLISPRDPAADYESETPAAAKPEPEKSPATGESASGPIPDRENGEYTPSSADRTALRHPTANACDLPQSRQNESSPAPHPRIASCAERESENRERILCFPSRDELAAYLERHPVRHALVLIKGSRGIGLEKIIGLL